MVRTQIQLTEEQSILLKRVATERGVSMAQIIREAIDRHLGVPDRLTRRQRAVEAIGGFRSGRSDVSAEHDRYLAADLNE